MSEYRVTRKSTPEDVNALNGVHSGEWTGPGDEGEIQGLVRIVHCVRIHTSQEAEEGRVSIRDVDRDHTRGSTALCYSPQELTLHPSG